MIPVPLLEIRTLDIWALLFGGALLELCMKGLSMFSKAKSSAERKAQLELHYLNYETAQKRRLGPQAFVETAKLERQVLAIEKDLEKMVAERKTRTERFAKVVKNSSLVVYAIIFCFYYSHSVLSIDGTRVKDTIVTSPEEEHQLATSFVQGFMFPLSMVGLGARVARFGLPTPGFGALLVLWSAQVTVGKLMDGIELLF